MGYWTHSPMPARCATHTTSQCSPPPNAPTLTHLDNHQSVCPSFALILCSFPWHTAAEIPGMCVIWLITVLHNFRSLKYLMIILASLFLVLFGVKVLVIKKLISSRYVVKTYLKYCGKLNKAGILHRVSNWRMDRGRFHKIWAQGANIEIAL